jgi:hypothetical protein
MTQASCKTTINMSADAIWQVIGEFGAAGQYLAGVLTCTVEGAGVGALRTLTSVDGSMIVERLDALDGDTRQLRYALLTDTPFRNCLTTTAVRNLGPNQAELEWSATFEPDGIPRSEAVEIY